MEPKAITAKAVQDGLLAGLRLLVVLIAGITTLFGLLAKRDLTALIAWVQSDGFIVFSSAAITAGTAIWGIWKTYSRSHESNTLKTIINDPSLPPEKPMAAPDILAAIPVLLVMGLLTGCATAGSVQLNTGKAFYTAQVALLSLQQTTAATCSVPAPRLVAPCKTAIDLLHEGALAEDAGFTAQQAGNASGLQAAITKLNELPAKLAALGVLEK